MCVNVEVVCLVLALFLIGQGVIHVYTYMLVDGTALVAD